MCYMQLGSPEGLSMQHFEASYSLDPPLFLLSNTGTSNFPMSNKMIYFSRCDMTMILNSVASGA